MCALVATQLLSELYLVHLVRVKMDIIKMLHLYSVTLAMNLVKLVQTILPVSLANRALYKFSILLTYVLATPQLSLTLLLKFALLAAINA